VAAERLPTTNLSWVDGPYFETLGIRLKSGRAFSDVEGVEPRDVVVVHGPLGAEPFIHAWEPFSQFPDSTLENGPGSFGRHVKLALRTDGDPRALGSAVRAGIGRIDPQLAVESIATMVDRVGGTVAPRRFSAMTLGAFATGSLLLAAVGLYGLLSFSVGERVREIAVRRQAR
jgi:hypothetical protein